MNDGHAVRGDVHVQLDRVRAELDRTLKGRQGILGEFSRRAAMADALHGPS